MLTMLEYSPAIMMKAPIYAHEYRQLRSRETKANGQTITMDPQKIVLTFIQGVVHLWFLGVRWNQKRPEIP